ncbi:DUF6776 family protein [Gilvimarinus sp. DA14]|uniref:DUF6776 family protein n=1 Tax=Gilvimarinus sp. DA14 TaxID=2956798 RepID=UPI0020B8D58B|nr:DUF6776 family protein [Gilvimarinus sp. DA14]UTF59397.1 hypothetical protein NHM04_13050 [Gilvimarinus sp. DA14]
MASVKGTKQYSMKVVPHRPGRRLLQLFILLLVVGCAVCGAYFFGFWQASGGNLPSFNDKERLTAELIEARAEADKLRQQVANLSMASEVDQMASEEVRSEVIELRQQIASLEADISFYRGLMAPGESSSGLALGDITLRPIGTQGRYRFKFVVQQIATNHQVLNGNLNVELVGHREGEQTRLPLYQLSSDYDSADIKLRFKYFQNVEGELTLPDGFEAQSLELTARSSGDDSQRVERSYSWLASEPQ